MVSVAIRNLHILVQHPIHGLKPLGVARELKVGRTELVQSRRLVVEERWRSKPAGESGGDTVGTAASYEFASACFDCLVLQAPCTVST